MRIYKVPYNFKHEEKIFGGYISLRQMLYLVLCVASISIFSISIVKTIIKLLVFLILFGVFMVVAFVKIEEINADRYLVNVIRFVCRKKKFIYER